MATPQRHKSGREYGYVGEQHIGELCRFGSPKHLGVSGPLVRPQSHMLSLNYNYLYRANNWILLHSCAHCRNDKITAVK